MTTASTGMTVPVPMARASSGAANRKAASTTTLNTDATPPFGLNPAVAARYPAAAANPPFGLNPEMENRYPVLKRKATMATASTGTTVPVPMARASRFVDVAAKTAQPKRAPSNSKAATSAAAAEDDDDDDKSHVSDLIDSGCDEDNHDDSRYLQNQHGVLFTSACVLTRRNFFSSIIVTVYFRVFCFASSPPDTR